MAPENHRPAGRILRQAVHLAGLRPGSFAPSLALFIICRRPFDVGDRIQIGVHAGDVIDLRVFQFTLMEIGRTDDIDFAYPAQRVYNNVIEGMRGSGPPPA
jgi:Mechanosensitive ion channel, beta-domain